jgi:uncharacterized protein (DUF433 family)
MDTRYRVDTILSWGNDKRARQKIYTDSDWLKTEQALLSEMQTDANICRCKDFTGTYGYD